MDANMVFGESLVRNYLLGLLWAEDTLGRATRLGVRTDAFSHRLRVAMSVSHQGRHLYGIPFGMLERHPYEPTFHWSGANGDWPAVNWAGVEADTLSVALLNKGLPSFRLEAGEAQGEVMMLTLLRSPGNPTYLHEPDSYTMTDWNGMRDAGEHDFRYAVTAYGGPFAESDVILDAAGYNGGLVAVPG